MVITVCLPGDPSDDLLAAAPAEVEYLVWDGTGAGPDGLDRARLFVPSYTAAAQPDVLTRLPALEVLQLQTAGADAWIGRVPPGVILCSARGVHTGSTAELAVAGMLAVLRELPRFVRAQQEHSFQRHFTDELGGKRVLVVGAGDIGRTVAAAVTVFGAEVSFVGSQARAGVHGPDELPALLPVHDIVVLAVPLTPATNGLVDRAFLAAMPDGALLVNVARGPVVDTAALLAELGRISAFLDVVDPEPLPADHPLWDAPNLFITPHTGGGTTHWARRADRLIGSQIDRVVRGEPLLNVVGPQY